RDGPPGSRDPADRRPRRGPPLERRLQCRPSGFGANAERVCADREPWSGLSRRAGARNRGERRPRVPRADPARALHQRAPPGGGRYEIGLPTARPEVSFNADLSVRWQSSRVRGELAAYRNQIGSYLYIAPTGATDAGSG